MKPVFDKLVMLTTSPDLIILGDRGTNQLHVLYALGDIIVFKSVTYMHTHVRVIRSYCCLTLMR